MKFMILECHPGYAVAIDENGRYVKIANLSYEVGQVVENPVFMKTFPAKASSLAKRISALCVAAACFVFLYFTMIKTNFIVAGQVNIKINPEVSMSVSSSGNVLKLAALNADGRLLIADYSYIGKKASTVSDELIQRAVLMNFLNEGGAVKITFTDGTNITALVEDLEELLKSNHITLIILPEGNTNAAVPSATNTPAPQVSPVTGAPSQTPTPSPEASPVQAPTSAPSATQAPQSTPRQIISSDEAIRIALNTMHSSNLTVLSCEYDADSYEYEVVIRSNGMEFEYEIDAVTGTILSCESEALNDDDDDDDDDDEDD